MLGYDLGEMTGKRNAPTAAEREHFATIAEAMRQEKREQIATAARSTTADGVLVGLELAALAGDTLEAEIAERARAAAQVGLRLRWLALGGSRP